MTSDPLEERLAEGLAGTAGRAPHPGDLVVGARERARRRRRQTAAVVAAVLAVVAIPVGLTVVGGGDAPADRRETTVADPVPGDWRTETWRDLSVSVPPEWGMGGGTDWCSGGQDLDAVGPYVSRPVMVETIDCSPSFGHGLHFGEPTRGELPPGTEGTVQQYRGDTYPDGSWIGYVSTQHAAVWVVAEDRVAARQVLDSATPVGEVDANGCATRLEMSSPSGNKRLSVCRYGGDGWLEQSRLLSSDDSQSARDAVAAAPGADPSGSCARPGPDVRVVTLQSAGFGYYVAVGAGCIGVVSNDAGTTKRLTSDVLRWSLPPDGSGAFSFLNYDDPGKAGSRRQ